MPQLQVVNFTPKPRTETTHLEKVLSGYTARDAEVRDQERDADELGDIYKRYQQEGMGIEQKIQAIRSNPRISPTTKTNAINDLVKVGEINVKLQDQASQKLKEQALRKEKADAALKKQTDETSKLERIQSSVKGIYDDLVTQNLMSDEEAAQRSKYDSEATARTVYAQKTKTQPSSEFDKVRQRKDAEELTKLETDIPKAKDALSNLDYMEKIFDKNLKGATGYAKGLIGSESASEFDNLGFTSIEPIIKLFNPVGPIPVQKLKIIRDEFQPKATDTRFVVKGKINALRRMGMQGVARAQERVALINKYQGKVPPEALQKFDQESSQLRDVLIDQEAYNLKTENMKDSDLVEGLVDKKTGKKLKGIPKKKADEFIQQGIVTYG